MMQGIDMEVVQWSFNVESKRKLLDVVPLVTALSQ